jgi:hypothetical protein
MNSGTVAAGTFGVHLHDSRPLADASNERNVADEVIIEIFVERRIDRVGATPFLSVGSEVRFIQPLLTRWTLCHPRR